uniref:Uncharacterized protein n=1 Tax=Knipowitschia caucasica TaxID=637954 RepID=A0AAV2J8C9_KNICA
MTYFSHLGTMLLSDSLATIGGLSVDLRRYGQWAVVTGATSGIGKAYATELARRGLDIVLVSRSEDKLQQVAKEIDEIYGRKTVIVQVDFADGHNIYPKIEKALQDLEIGILVNNVGIAYSKNFAFFLETSDAHKKIANIVNCNMLSVPQMSKLVLPLMVSRGRGLIINISSETGVRPHPLLTLYSATKLFVTYFSQCLHAEYKSKGIIVQCVAPCMVSTNMTKHTAVSCMSKSAQEFVDEALNTVGYSTYTSGCLSHALQSVALTVLLPDWLRMSSVFIRLLRKISDVSPSHKEKLKLMQKEE